MQPVSKGRRVGSFFIVLGVFALGVVIQFASVFALMLVEMLVSLLRGGGDFAEIITGIASQTLEALLLSQLVSVAVFGSWYYFGLRKKQRGIPAQRFTPRAAGGLLLVGIGLNVLISCVLDLVDRLAPTVMERYQQLMESAGIGELTWLAVLTTCLLAPLSEEVIFRGVMLHYARQVSGRFWVANCLQAALFGLMHFNLVQGVYAFILGLLLGAVARRYNKLLPSILLHCVFNSTSTFLIEPLTAALPDTTAVQVLLFLAAAAVCWLGLWAMEMRFFRRVAQKERPSSQSGGETK